MRFHLPPPFPCVKLLLDRPSCHRHRDLHPENLLLASPEDDTSIKLAGFGCAGSVRDGQLRDPWGTPGYRAPEILSGRPYGTVSGTFMLGVSTRTHYMKDIVLAVDGGAMSCHAMPGVYRVASVRVKTVSYAGLRERVQLPWHVSVLYMKAILLSCLHRPSPVSSCRR